MAQQYDFTGLDAPVTEDELAGVTQAPPRTSAPVDDLFAPVQAHELPPTQAQLAAQAKAQGFDDTSRGFEHSVTRGITRAGLMTLAAPAELLNLGSDVLQYGASHIAHAIDPRVKPMAWKDTSRTKDIPFLAPFGADAWYNAVGPHGLNVYPHRRPDETPLESAGGTLGEFATGGVTGRALVSRSLTTPAQIAMANRALAAETAAGTIGSEVGAATDKASGGDGSTGRMVGGMAMLAPTMLTQAGNLTRYVLRGGNAGAAEMNTAINASDRLATARGDTYQPNMAQRMIDAVFGGSGRNLDLTTGQAAPSRGMGRIIERTAAFMPGGAPVVINKLRNQVANAAQTVQNIVERQVQRFNARATVENQTRVPQARYTMQQTGRPPSDALETPLPIIPGINDAEAGSAIERGLGERVAVNERVRRMAEADFQNRMPANSHVSMDNTINTLEGLEVRLPGSPNVSQGTLRSPVIGNLRNELIQDATNGPNGTVTIPFGTLRAVRQRVGEFLNGDANALGPSRMSEADARALYASLSEDMSNAARAAGGDVWESWQRAQSVTRTAVEVAGDARNVVNRQTVEGIEKAVEEGAGSRVNDAMAALPDRERDVVVGNIFRKWGLAKAGDQNSAGTQWSFDSFLTNAAKAMKNGSFQALTRSTDNALNAAYRDLVTMAERVRARAKFLPNQSNSGRTMISGGSLMAGAALAVTQPYAAAALLAATHVAPYALAKLMTNPRFIRWLARTGEMSAASMPGHLMRLGSLATDRDTAEAVRDYVGAMAQEFQKGDLLDKAAMIDPTPVSETARQARSFATGKTALTGENLLAAGGMIGMAALGMGPEGKMLKGAELKAARDAEKAAAAAAKAAKGYPDQGHWQDLEGAMSRTRDTSSEHTIGAQRAERSTASTRSRPEDQAAIDKALLDAKLSSVVKVKEKGADGVEVEREVTQYGKGAKAAEQAIRAAIRNVRDQFPEGEWQRITPRKITMKADRKGNLTPEIEWKSEDDYNLTGGFRKGTPEYQSRVLKAADGGVKVILDVLRRANAGDKAAQTIIRQMGWYREFTKKGFDAFGGFFPVTRDLLSASSPNTAVAQNYVFAQKGGRALSQGHFDEKMNALGENMTGNTGPNAIPDDIKITQPSGSWFGMNSGNMMNAIRERWLQKVPGQAPKARQFAANLGGLDLRATIDVWAARFLNRMNGGKPVPIPAESGVGGALDAKGMFSTGDFGFGQAVFANIATQLNRSGALRSELHKLGYTHVTPADLQALTWFIEKEHWTKKNWTSAAGEGGSFEQMLDLDPLERHQAGFSIQQSAPPTDAEVKAVRDDLERTLATEKDVRMFRAHPTRGQYGSDTERSFDMEVVAKPGWDASAYKRKVVELAKKHGQKDVFFSRRLTPAEAETNQNARPGIEIYTRGRVPAHELDGIMGKFREAGIDGFTFVTENRLAERKIGGSEPDTFQGLRLQIVPEFGMMFDDAMRRKMVEDPNAMREHMTEQVDKMLDVIAGLQSDNKIIDARLHRYDTEVIHETEYDDFLTGRGDFNAGASGGSAGEARGGWQGRSGHENAARRDRALAKRGGG